MSEYGHARRGGMNGILVDTDELRIFAHEMKLKAIDLYIPLPGVLPVAQMLEMSDEDHNCDDYDAKYWERENGSHGWCCSGCGKVVQWG